MDASNEDADICNVLEYGDFFEELLIPAMGLVNDARMMIESLQ